MTDESTRDALATPPAKIFIGGEWVDGERGSFTSENPATEESICEVGAAGAGDVDRAVEAAQAALRGPWGTKFSPRQRGHLLWKIADALEERIDEFARLETADNGKPIFESRYVDVPAAIDALRYFGGWGRQVRRPDLAGGRPVRARLHPARADGCRGGHHAVELPHHPGSVEDRAGSGLRQHGHPEAGLQHPFDRA